jgi:hypothetical protein
MSHPGVPVLPPLSKWKKLDPEDRKIIAKLLTWFFVSTVGTVFIFGTLPVENEPYVE